MVLEAKEGGGQDHREEGPKGSQPKGVGQAGQGLGYSHSRKNEWRDIRKDLATYAPRRGWTELLRLLHQLLQMPRKKLIILVPETGGWTT